MLNGRLITTFAGAALAQPAVVLHGIKLYNHLGESADGLCALLDTGADRSMVPKELVENMKLKEVGRRTVRGYDGKGTKHPIVKCSVVIDRLGVTPLVPLAVPVTSAATDDDADFNWMLLGRDFLNGVFKRSFCADFRLRSWSIGESTVARRALLRLISRM